MPLCKESHVQSIFDTMLAERRIIYLVLKLPLVEGKMIY